MFVKRGCDIMINRILFLIKDLLINYSILFLLFSFLDPDSGSVRINCIP